MSIQIPFLKLL